MANVTAKCKIKGQHGNIIRPFAWHAWDVTIPIATLTQAQADTIVFPDVIPPGSIYMDLRMLILSSAASSSGNFTVALASYEQVLATQALQNAATLLSVTDFQGAGRAAMSTPVVATQTHGVTTFNDIVAIDAATLQGKLVASITPAATFTDGALRILFAAMMGRSDY